MRSVYESFLSVYVHSRISFLKEFVGGEVGEGSVRVGREVVIPRYRFLHKSARGGRRGIAEPASRNNVLGPIPRRTAPNPSSSTVTLANLGKKNLNHKLTSGERYTTRPNTMPKIHALRGHNTENPKTIFPEKGLRPALVPNHTLMFP